MAKQGFSILCPHCLEWSDFDFNPNEVVINSKKELLNILSEIEKNPITYTHNKLLRCEQPPWICPSPFEAFVCKSEKDAFEFSNLPNAWSVIRDFRLFKYDHHNRWANYVGLLVFIQPVPRPKHVLLTRLIDRDILSKSLVGISREVGAPVTSYVANIYQKDNTEFRTYWLPVEQFSTSHKLVPTGYNPLCAQCREIVLNEILNHYDSVVKPSNCPLEFGSKGTCAGEDAVCLSQNWYHCPAFLQARLKKQVCYHSDLMLIKKVSNEFMQQDYKGWSFHFCWAGFFELAFPIVVHDVLVGVLMTGQFLVEGSKTPNYKNLINKNPELKNYSNRITRFLNILDEAQPGDSDEYLSASYYLSENRLLYISKIMIENASRIGSSATKIYRNFRYKSEALFKKEIISKVNLLRDSKDIIKIMERLRSFWGFAGCYLFSTSEGNGTLYLTGLSDIRHNKYFGTDKIQIGRLDIEPLQVRPFSFTFDTEKVSEPTNVYVEKLFHVFADIRRKNIIKFISGQFFFGVASSACDGNFYMLLFGPRENTSISILPMKYPGSISDICREMMFETCLNIISNLRIN